MKQKTLPQRCFTLAALHSSIPPKFGVNVEPLVHDTFQTFDEIVEVLDLLCLVLVVP